MLFDPSRELFICCGLEQLAGLEEQKEHHVGRVLAIMRIRVNLERRPPVIAIAGPSQPLLLGSLCL